MIDAPTVKVRVVSRAKNEYLARLVDRFGTVKAVAEDLGIHPVLMSQWLHFRQQLRLYSRSAKVRERNAAIAARIEELTGVSIHEVFPGLLPSELEKLSRPVVKTQEIRLTRLTSAVETRYLTYQPSGAIDGEMDREAVAARIHGSLDILPEREKLIIELRYGFNGHTPHSTPEIAKIIGRSGQRILQLERAAMRRLKQNVFLRMIDPEK